MSMMSKNAGRVDPDTGWETDASWDAYKRALPGTIAEVANRVGVSGRRAEKSLGILRGFKLVQRDGDAWSVVE